jgi:hypothetical protein
MSKVDVECNRVRLVFADHRQGRRAASGDERLESVLVGGLE